MTIIFLSGHVSAVDVELSIRYIGLSPIMYNRAISSYYTVLGPKLRTSNSCRLVSFILFSLSF